MIMNQFRIPCRFQGPLQGAISLLRPIVFRPMKNTDFRADLEWSGLKL